MHIIDIKVKLWSHIKEESNEFGKTFKSDFLDTNQAWNALKSKLYDLCSYSGKGHQTKSWSTLVNTSIRHLTYTERQKLGVTTLEYRRTRANIIQIYKILNKIDVVNLNTFTILDDAITRGPYKKN